MCQTGLINVVLLLCLFNAEGVECCYELSTARDSSPTSLLAFVFIYAYWIFMNCCYVTVSIKVIRLVLVPV